MRKYGNSSKFLKNWLEIHKMTRNFQTCPKYKLNKIKIDQKDLLEICTSNYKLLR